MWDQGVIGVLGLACDVVGSLLLGVVWFWLLAVTACSVLIWCCCIWRVCWWLLLLQPLVVVFRWKLLVVLGSTDQSNLGFASTGTTQAR